MPITNYMAESIFRHLVGQEQMEFTFTKYLGLLLGTPTVAGSYTEPSPSDYIRKGIGPWSRASGGLTSNDEPLEFEAAEVDWGEVTHIGLFDSQEGGHLLGWDTLPRSKTVDSGDIVQMAAASLTIDFSSVAFSDYYKDKLLDHITGEVLLDIPTSLYVGLLIEVPEAPGVIYYEAYDLGGYARVEALPSDWEIPNSGRLRNESHLDFGTAIAYWGTIVAVGLFDAVTAGNLLAWAELTTARTVDGGDSFVLPRRDIILQFT